MKKILTIITATLVLALCSGGSLMAQEKTVDSTKVVLSDGTMVINTSAICADVEGYMENTPVEITIRKDTIIKVVALPNEETPRYFKLAEAILQKWVGLTTKKGLELEVDAVSGATYSSEALIENMRAGLKKALEK